MSELIPFGTIKEDWCVYCNGGANRILGGDDEWYCEVCQNRYFKAIKEYYTKVVDQDFKEKKKG